MNGVDLIFLEPQQLQDNPMSFTATGLHTASPVPKTSSTRNTSLMSRVPLELINTFTHELKMNTNPLP